MVLKKLKPGMVVYDVKRATGLQTFNGKWRIWSVQIKEIDEEKERVLASHNYNTAIWFSKSVWSKWRLNRPD